MSLASKHSRPIIRSGVAYRYNVFLNSGWYDLTVQVKSGHGQKLTVQFDVLGEEGQITPKHAGEAIDFGLTNGWTPNKRNAKPFKGRFKFGKFYTWAEVQAALKL